MTQATLGYGTLFKIGDGGGPEAFTTAAEVSNISDIGPESEEVEATNHDSPSGFREFIAGLKDNGEISLELNFLPGNTLHQQMFNDVSGGNKRNYKIVFPDAGAAEVAFAALVKAFKIAAPVDDRLTAAVTIRVSGAMTLTP